MSRGTYRRKDVFTLGEMPHDVAAPYEIQIVRHPDGHRVIEICNHSNVIARMMVDGTEGMIAARRIVLAVNAAEKNIARRNNYERTGRYGDKGAPAVPSATQTINAAPGIGGQASGRTFSKGNPAGERCPVAAPVQERKL